jgi:parallel beta helix pectate lyase-like protein
MVFCVLSVDGHWGGRPVRSGSKSERQLRQTRFYREALHLLATVNPQGPNTIAVSGSCKGNFVIQGMDRLLLITRKGASITDRSNGSLAVLDIEDSRSVTVQGFTINGGGGGVNCGSASVCYLTGNTIQDGAGTGVGVGHGSHAFLESNVIQNNGGSGSMVSGASQVFSSNDVFQGNAAQGVNLAGAYFEASNSSFLNNGVGIRAGVGTVLLLGGTISGSGGDGMTLLGSSTAVFRGPTITGNAGKGVHLEDGSFAGFVAASITGNLSGTDVDCAPQFPITRFVERTGGITNCVEPVSNAKLKAVE